MLAILNYNENKVKEGIAKCIDGNAFGCPVDQLRFKEKLNGFEAFTKQNRRASAKAVHISLNFHPSDKLDETILRSITEDYMERIGFGNQPYLVYQHYDAGHPHVHIVTTNIQKDGNRMVLFRIGKYESERARQHIETTFGLVKAAGRKEEVQDFNESRKMTYGKSETKRSIGNIVRSVIRSYRYTSLPEFNAILRQFNIVADRGTEHSRMFSKGGLLYRALNENGEKIGVPIKASTISGKPTLAFLEEQFKLNDVLRRPHRERLVGIIDNAFGTRKEMTKASFIKTLSQQGVFVLFRQNEEGRIYGITFVDNKTKVVFNGSDLRKAYGAKAITERLTNLNSQAPTQIQPAFVSALPEKTESIETGTEAVIKDLTEAKQHDFSSPDSAMKRRRRKKRRGRSL
jgi:hypothetical protein